MAKEQYTIDAKGKILGRLASEAAMILRGKNTPDFEPYKNSEHMLTITNAAHIKLSGNKADTKEYKQYSGYPGGLKMVKFEELFQRDPRLVVLRTIKGMLPKNKLSQQILKNLTIYNDDGSNAK